MRLSTWLVTENQIRIITLTQDGVAVRDPERRCAYCTSKVGEQHAAKCVHRKRSVVVRTIVEHVILVPDDWDVGMVEFHRDGSSRCASNFGDEIAKLCERGCICGQTIAEFVREATAEDEARDGVTVGGAS